MMAPTLAEAEAHDDGQAYDSGVQRGRPIWMSVLFYFGLVLWFFGLLVAIAGFEFYMVTEETQLNKGTTADLLIADTWKVSKIEKAKSGDPGQPPAWWTKGDVWTFHMGGKAETGRLMESVNRYERDPAAGFRTWKWTTKDDELTMASKGEKPITFKVAQRPKGGLALNVVGEEGGPALVVEKTEAVNAFPDLRIVFYGGVLAPALIAFLLAWLISREVFYNGCLRFLLGWPLTVVLSLGLGAGAGFLLDVLDDYSHVAEPYWQMLGLLQGAIGAGTGLVLSVLSCLRPT
ncbi:MAG TPA: hypothetical protein VE988_04230 [Gemmataceae bacterium]|nr:hypothetical protein [Gemmataceae bacterium]